MEIKQITPQIEQHRKQLHQGQNQYQKNPYSPAFTGPVDTLVAVPNVFV